MKMFQEVSLENSETQRIQMITKSNYAREIYDGDAKAKEKLHLGIFSNKLQFI